MNRPLAFTAHLAWISALALTACHDGDDAEAEAPAATMLTGVAAVGAPLANASVTVSDADAATPDVTTTAAANGSYSADVSSLKAPLLVKASGTHDGAATIHWAVVPSVTASSVNTANVTPLTTAVAALVAPAGDPQALSTVATLTASATPAKVGDATALIVNTLRTDPQTATALGANFDPLSTSFAADGQGVDAVLNRIEVSVSPAGVALTNQATPIAPGGSAPPPVVLTPTMTATPAVVPTLPPTAAASDLPTAAELASLARKFDDCMALPLTSRVTMDAAGTVTAVAAACDYAAPNYRSNGRSWVQDVGQFTFSKPQLNGAKLRDGRVVLALAPEGETDPKVHKHPYCNDNPCAVARWAATSASNRAVATDWLLAKVNGQWNFVGNQRPYSAFVEPRLLRKINTNRNGPAAGSVIDPYFLKDRFESQLRLRFDMANTQADTNDVRAVRFTGPGLPSAGVVLVRSQRCGTDDRMAITNQAGTTFVYGTNSLQFWTSGAASDFTLDAANLDGTALATPVPVNSGTTASFQDFSPAPVASQSTSIPAWSRYKIEVFRFSSASNTPDEIFHVRINAAAENASAGAAKSWPTLDPAFVASYLVPNAANSGSFMDMARTMAWSNPANGHVLDSYLFAQNFATQTNVQGESAFYGLRTRLDFEPAVWGDSSGTGWRFASTVSGTSLSSFTQNTGSNPNPRCAGTPGLVALTDNVNDYREVGLSFRGADRKLYTAAWYWEN